MKNIVSIDSLKMRHGKWIDLLIMMLICLSVIGLSLWLFMLGADRDNMTLLMLVGVVLSTVSTGNFLYGLLSSIICAMAYNFFFTEPMYGFSIAHSQDLLTLLFFIAATLMCSMVTTGLRRREEIAHYNEKTSQLIYEVSEFFLDKSGVAEAVQGAITYIFNSTGYPCSVELNDRCFSELPLKYVHEDFSVSAVGAVLPLQGLHGQIGMVSFDTEVFHNDSFDADKFVRTVLYQMALVLERESLAISQEKMLLAVERERLKTTLLRSVSHDIRTPLTAISGSSSTILDNYDYLDDDSIRQLVRNIRDEVGWLSLTVQNILDLTRVTSGEIDLNLEYEALDDLINQAVSRMAMLSERRPVKITYPPEILLIRVDGRLFSQLLVNILDNAYKHSGADSHVTLTAYRSDNNAVIEVADDGPGVDEDILPTVFDSFITRSHNDSDKGRGVGLGLAICKAIVEAHHGIISAENMPQSGALFRVVIPLEEE